MPPPHPGSLQRNDKENDHAVEGDGSESMDEATGAKASDDYGVFPPSNHENLHLLPHPASSLSTQLSSSASNFSYSSPSSSSSASSSYSDADEEELDDPCPPKPPIQVTVTGCDRPGWLQIGIGLIRSKILYSIAGSRGGVGGRLFWSVGTLVAVTTWVWWLYMRIRFRRRWTGLVQWIRERDEKIAQLLHQIAQMNELLLMKHKDFAYRLPN